MSDTGSVVVSKTTGIARVTFSHPRSNSLPGKLLRELAAAITNCGTDAAVNVIILESSGAKAFCAGASFDELLSVGDIDAAIHFFSGFALVINAMRTAPKMIIGRVSGKAVGGGVGLIAACDYVVATSNAAIRLSEYALGFGPFVIGPAVERRVGPAAFGKLAISADWFDAAWAERHGLYTEVVGDAAVLDQRIAELSAKLAVASPAATAALKKVLWEDTGHWEQLLSERVAITSRLALTEFAQQKIRSQG